MHALIKVSAGIFRKLSSSKEKERNTGKKREREREKKAKQKKKDAFLTHNDVELIHFTIRPTA